MIQKISAPPSTEKPRLHSQMKSIPTQPVASQRVVPQSPQPVAQGTVPATKPTINPLSMYEQTQRKLKEQILAVQRQSRNMKSQEKTIFYQGLSAFGASFVLIIIAIFGIVPLLIRFAGNLSTLSVFPQTDKIPPTVPVYSALPQAIKETSLEIKGYAEAKSQVVVVKNGSESNRVTTPDNGEFTVSVSLDDGDNKIALYSLDESNNESQLSREYIVRSDNTSPEVEWESPEDQKTIRNLREQTIEVKGKVNEKAKVFLNDRQITTTNENEFSTQFRLENEENTLKLKIVDLAGNEIEQERMVFFKP